MASPGDQFDACFGDLVAVAYRVGFRLLGDRSEAEEVAQETLARALARWPSVSGHAEPWVARVAANLAISRGRRRRPTIPFGDTDGPPSGTDPQSLVLERIGLINALARLPRRQREVIALRYIADLPEAEVASAMRTSVGTVKQHSHRALKRLRSDLAPHTAILEADDA